MLKLRALATTLALGLLTSAIGPAAATTPSPAPIVKSDGHLSTTSGTVVTPPPVVPGPVLNPPAFKDINYSLFYTEINWMAAQRITAGYSDGTYRPTRTLDRAASAAFLYRLAGSPKFTAPKISSFADVRPGAAFYKEIHWAHQRGLLAGTPVKASRPHFRATRAITRAEMAQAVFVYSGASKTYKAPSVSKFTDVSTRSAFYRAISWVDVKAISKGYPAGSRVAYRPSDPVTREIGAGFLYQLAHKSGR